MYWVFKGIYIKLCLLYYTLKLHIGLLNVLSPMLGTSELSVWDSSSDSDTILSCGPCSVEFSLQRRVGVNTVKPNISLKFSEAYDHNILLNVSEIYTQKWVDFCRSSRYKNIDLKGLELVRGIPLDIIFKYFKKFKNKNLLRNIYQHPYLFKWKVRSLSGILLSLPWEPDLWYVGLLVPMQYCRHPWWLRGQESANAGNTGSSLGWEDPLEKGMATHFSISAWRISWTEEL